MNIVCFWWDNWCGSYGPLYVKRLYQALKENSSTPFRFVCFTDRPDLIECEAIKFEPYLLWNLNKFQCYDQKFGLEGDVVSFDLDTIILGNIDPFLHFNNLLVTQKNMKGRNLAAGGIVGAKSWYGRKHFHNIVNNKRRIEKETKGAERMYIRKYIPHAPFWEISGVYSYKVHGIPGDARVINFHGSPRPHETEIGRRYLGL